MDRDEGLLSVLLSLSAQRVLPLLTKLRSSEGNAFPLRVKKAISYPKFPNKSNFTFVENKFPTSPQPTKFL